MRVMPTPTARIQLNPAYNNPDSVETIRERAAMIVSGKRDNHEITPGETRWSIDQAGNNWWFGWDPRGKSINISARYAGDDIILHVKALIIWAFDLERFQ